MPIPTSLKHKPVMVCDNYENIDGRKAYSSDAKYLSLGLAQWNDRGTIDIAAKIWRHTGEKWSRQSEEMSLNRVLDLAILIIRSQAYFRDAYKFSRLYDEEQVQIDRIGMQGDAMNISVCTENECLDTDIKLFRDALLKDDEIISERCKILSTLLKEAGY